MSTYFISHATPDRDFVETKIISLLDAMGISHWYSSEHIRSAEQWERSIARGLESCDGLILVMSPDAAMSEWVRDELCWAMEHRAGRIIPVVCRACDPASFHIRLPRLQHVDFSSNAEKATYSLISTLKELEDHIKSRMRSVSGSWEGNIQQFRSKKDKVTEYKAALRLFVTTKGQVSGVITGFWDDVPHNFKVTGGFSYERFVQLSYNSEDYSSIQFGTIIMELDTLGREMIGRMVGYGAISKSIVSGEIILHKVA